MVQNFMSLDFLLIGIILIFSSLFILQMWAILRIKKMLIRVAEIHAWVRAGKLGTASQQKYTIKIPEKCKNCLFRATYLSQSEDIQFIYYCRKQDKEIQLNDSCKQFQLDPQLIESQK